MVKKNDKGVAVGDRCRLIYTTENFEEGTVKAIITRTDGVRYQIDLGDDRSFTGRAQNFRPLCFSAGTRLR